MRHRVNPWFKVGVSAWSLGLEASSVIAMRSLKIAAGGPQGEAEAQRMVAEKIDAGLALQAMAMTGALGASPAAMSAKTVAHYRKKVRANRRRLAKG